MGKLETSNEVTGVVEPSILATANLSISDTAKQSLFLSLIEQSAHESVSSPVLSQFSCNGISSDVLPHLKSTLDTVLLSPEPSIALNSLHRAGIFRSFPQLDVLDRIEQDSKWHPEGNVWIHTMMVVDEAALLLRDSPVRLSSDERAGVMWGVLLHDIGKATTTHVREFDGRIVAPKHEEAGVEPARVILEQLGVDANVRAVALTIVERHMKPPMLYRELKEGALNEASYERAVGRLRRRIDPVHLEPLLISSMADRLGRGAGGCRDEKIEFALPMIKSLATA